MRTLTRRALLTTLGLALLPGLAAARICGSQVHNDIWAVGGRVVNGTCTSTTEWAVDTNGNLVPTTDNVSALGLSTLRFSDVETTNINSGNGALTLGTGNITAATAAGSTVSQGTVGTANAAGTGNATYPSQLKVVGSIVTPSVAIGSQSGQNTGVNISTTIPVIGLYQTLISSGLNIQLTSTPTIATTTTPSGAVGVPDGTWLILTSTAGVGNIILQDQGQLSGSLLALGAATRTISKTKTLTLIFNAALSRWQELAYGNNQGN